MFELLVFAAAFLASAAPPGPDTLTVFGRGLEGGLRSALPFAVGVLVAKLTLLALAVFGVAEIAQRAEPAFVAVKFLGAAYLIMIGARLALRPSTTNTGSEPDRGRLDALTGFGLGVANPAAVVFYVALVPNVVDLDTVDVRSYLALAVVLIACWCLVAATYAGLAGRLRSVLRSELAQRRMQRASGTTMIGAGVIVATR